MAETLRELVVSLSLQSDNFDKNIKSVNNQIREAESRFEAAGAGIDNFARSEQGAQAKASLLTDKLRMQGQITQQYERALSQASATLQKNVATQQGLSAKLDSAKKSQAGLNKEVERAKVALSSAEKAYGKNSAVANNAREALAELTDQQDTAAAEVQKLESQLSAQSKTLQRNADEVTRAETALNKAKAAESATKAELDKTNRAIEMHRAKWESAAESLDKFGQRATTAGTNLSRVGQSLSMYVTAPLLALGGASVVAFGQLDTAARKVSTVADDTILSLDGIKTGVRNLSNDTGVAATDVAAGLYDMISANNDTANSMDYMRIATKASIGGFADQSTAVDGLTTVMNAYGLQGGASMQKVSDQMLTAQNYGKTTFGQIASSIGNVIPLAAQFKTGTDELFGSLAVLTKQGIGTSEAVTGLKAVYSNVLKPSTEASEAAKTMGLDFSAAALESKGLGGFLEDVAAKTGGSTEKISQLFGSVEALNTVLALTSASGRKDFAGAMQAMQSSAGSTEKAYDTMMGGIEGATKRAKATGENFVAMLGEDLSPTLNDLIDTADGWLDSLSKMDAGQRQTLISTAAWLAAIGPGIMVIGKLNTAVGAVSTGLSAFMKASVEAGGGLKGLLSATGGLLGPAGIAVLAGAVLYGAYQWYDYASGAKAAREAMQSMMDTAKKWKETQATTIFDTGNDSLARFGLSKESFTGGQTELQDWLSRLSDTWSDGKKETNEIVKSYVDEFKSGSDKVREAIKDRQKTQEKYGVTGDKTAEEDLKKLDQYDKQVERLLKKKKNGKLSEEDQQTLNRLIQERVEIQLKYTTGEGGGYDSLTQAVEAEKARLAAEGGKPGTDLYGDTLKGAGQAHQAQVEAINQSYRDQYADIMAITNEQERKDALDQLNTEHMQALKKAQEEYNAVLGKYAPETFQTPEMQQAQKDLQTITDLVSKIKTEGAETPEGIKDLQKLDELTKGMDEGKIASLKALIDQLNQNDLGNINLSGEGQPAITASSLLGGYDTVAAFLEANKGEWTGGLAGLFGATGEEANRVLVEMGLTPESQTLMDSLTAMEKAGVQVLINAYVPTDTTLVTPPPTMVEAMISAYKAAVDAGVQQPDEQVEALIKAYNEAPDGATISVPKGQVDALIGAYKAAEGAGVAAPSAAVTAQISAYTEQTGASVAMPSEAVQAFIDQYKAAVDAGVAPPNKDVDAFIASYVNTPNTTVAVPSGTVNALISAYVASDGATTAPPNSTVTAIIGEYQSAANAVLPQPIVNATAMVDFSALDQAALDAYYTANPGTKPTVITEVGLQQGWAGTLKSAYDSGILTVWKDGAKLELTPEVLKQIAVTDIWAGGTDEDGNAKLDVIITPKTGTKEAVGAAEGPMNEVPQNFLPDVLKSSTSDKVTSIQSLAQGVQDLADAGEEFTSQQGKSVLLDQLNSLNPTDLENIGTYIAAAMAALSSGTLSEEDAAALQAQLDAMLAVVRAADQYLGVGNDISAGIANGMKAYGWSGDASTLANSIESAIRGALNSNSPAIKMVPVGVDIAAGVAQGIEDGTYKVENAMVKMAGKALAKAKEALIINSPSHLFRNEVGRSIPEGTAQGVLEEIKRQEPIIANAFRSLVQPALDGARASTIDNRKAYSIRAGDVVMQHVYLSDKLDAQGIAYEIGGVQVSQLRALGVRP